MLKNFNWPFIGNKNVVDFLQKNIANNMISGAYIFLGLAGLGKSTIAHYFAKSLLCENKNATNTILPCENCIVCNKLQAVEKHKTENNGRTLYGDFYLINKENQAKNISIQQIRDFIRMLRMSSFFNSYKIGIIESAETLSLGAANALLKTLEEPKQKVVIILIVSNIKDLPETIISRCQVLNFYPVASDVIYDYLITKCGITHSIAKNLSRLCLNRPAFAVKFLQDKNFYNSYIEKVNIFLKFYKQDINSCFKMIEELIKNNIHNQTPAQLAIDAIEIWTGLARDLLLLNLEHIDLIQHQIVSDKLNTQIPQQTDVLKIIKILEKAKKYLKANVNPKLVLESVVCNI